MIEPTAIVYPSADGLHTIHAKQWRPKGAPRGVIQIVHGVSEYVARYQHVAQFFCERGYLVCGADHLGHGDTAQGEDYGYFGSRGSWSVVVADVHRLRQLQEVAYPAVPYVLLGHSMGSFLTRSYLMDYPNTVSAAVLSGTGQAPATLVWLGKIIAGLECLRLGPQGNSALVDRLSFDAYNEKFAPNRTSADWISRDEGVVDAYLNDPLCRVKPTVSMFRAMMGALQTIGKLKHVRAMYPTTPVYFLCGDCDPVGDMGEGVDRVVDLFVRAGCVDVTLKRYVGGRHEMLNEINREQVLADLERWLEEKGM